MVSKFTKSLVLVVLILLVMVTGGRMLYLSANVTSPRGLAANQKDIFPFDKWARTHKTESRRLGWILAMGPTVVMFVVIVLYGKPYGLLRKHRRKWI